MKKNFFFWMAAIVMLIMSSCQQEAGFGTEATVSFQVGTPEIATRAYSDGTTATVLQYAVYDADGKELTDLTRSVANQKADNINIEKTVNLQLTTGNTYSVIFWAAAQDAPYTVDFDAKTMTVDYTNAVSNDENRDAFYKHHTFTVTGAQTEIIELRRPFAQLNIGTNDYVASTSAGYTPTQSKVVVKNIYNTLNLVDGVVTGEEEVVYGYYAIPTNETFPVADYEYLAMNYLLVAKDQGVIDVEFSYTDGSNEKTRTVGSVPVQRNHRTNIYGQLLTSNVDINVIIEPEYDEDDYNNEGKLNDYVVFTAAELQALLDKATGETVINLGADIKGDVVDVQKADRHIVIEGCGKKYDGTIKIHSNSNYNNGSITIKNINFETSTDSENFVEALENGSERYSNNITVDGCTFTATGAVENTVVGVQIKATRGAKILNCTATNMHSLLQAQSCDTDVIEVNNCTIKGKGGVAFKQVKKAVVEGSKIEATGYGIRFDGNIDNYAITVKDNDVKAAQPFIVRKMTAQNNIITLEGENTLTVSAASIAAEAPAYQIIITNGSDDQEYVTPTGTYKLNGAGKYVVYPPLVYKDKTYHVYSAYGLVELSGKTINGGETVKLESNIDLEGIEFNGLSAFHSENNNTFDGQGNTVSNWTNNSGASDMGFIKGWVGTIKNVNFENCYLKTAGRSAIVAGNVYGNIENVHVNNCSIEDSYWACGIIAGLYNSGSVTNCTVTNSSVKSNGGTGGIVGVINETGGERSLVKCSVSNSTINNTGAYGAPYTGGALVGMFYADATFKFVGCSVSNNTLVGDLIFEKYPEDEIVVEE